jgi:phosphoribosylaminoimidazole-succinocarboxamide synthase
MEMLYEGKAKRIFKTDDEKIYRVFFKDDATAQNGLKRGTIESKGVINNRISSMLFGLLEKAGVRTHFIRAVSDCEMDVMALRIFPLEVIIRNIAAGSLCKRLGIEEGRVLEKPLFELCYKDDSLGDPFINEDHALMLGLATEKELGEIRVTALRVNEVLKAFFLEVGIKLVDFKLEFGRADGEVILADEISPDTCRLWDEKTNDKLDKDRFRSDLGNVEQAYEEVLSRLSHHKE